MIRRFLPLLRCFADAFACRANAHFALLLPRHYADYAPMLPLITIFAMIFSIIFCFRYADFATPYFACRHAVA